VIAAADLEAVASALRAALGLGEPFRDPGVGEFGLSNVVFELGDCFLEVIAPTGDGTAAGRWIDRRGGDGGYMVIFDVEDLEGARTRAAQAGARVVWQIDLPDISGTHLHPADMLGAIVSIDRSDPYGSWRWGGPGWTGGIGQAGPGRLAGIIVSVAEPEEAAARWAGVLGLRVTAGESPSIALDGAEIVFRRAADPLGQEISEFLVQAPGPPETSIVGGVAIRRIPPG